jgi:transposase-like protein
LAEKFQKDFKLLNKNNGGEDIVSMKLKIIGFYDKYGLKATRDAFEISKNTIYKMLCIIQGLTFAGEIPYNKALKIL